MRLDNETLRVLSGAVIEGDRLKITEQLDCQLYTRVNKALEAAGGKWNRSAKAHVFGEDIGTLIDDLCVTGEIGTKQDKQQFFTPEALADRVVALADIQDCNMVLEPSAGDGALIRAIERCGASMMEVYAVEWDPALYQKLQAEKLTSFSLCGDFLQSGLAPKSFDRIIMNPPFTKQQDIDHVTHAHSLLKPSGRLVAIMSAGVTFREDQKARRFRGLVEDHGGTIEPLPEGSFRESGTMVNTVLVTIDG